MLTAFSSDRDFDMGYSTQNRRSERSGQKPDLAAICRLNRGPAWAEAEPTRLVVV